MLVNIGSENSATTKAYDLLTRGIKRINSSLLAWPCSALLKNQLAWPCEAVLLLTRSEAIVRGMSHSEAIILLYARLLSLPFM